MRSFNSSSFCLRQAGCEGCEAAAATLALTLAIGTVLDFNKKFFYNIYTIKNKGVNIMNNLTALIEDNYYKLNSTTGFLEFIGADGLATIKEYVANFTGTELLEHYTTNDYLIEFLKDKVRVNLDESLKVASIYMDMLYSMYKDY
jgi:hypothetical protein